MIRCVSSSESDPSDMFKKYRNSLSELLPAPSLILLGIEIADLLICEVNPYCSSFGNDAVNSYSFYKLYRLLPNIHVLMIHVFMS